MIDSRAGTCRISSKDAFIGRTGLGAYAEHLQVFDVKRSSLKQSSNDVERPLHRLEQLLKLVGSGL
ncbi:hypothetical protein [Nonomuraea angiospora]